MSTTRHPNVVNERDLEPRVIERGQHRMQARRLGSPAGSNMLGATLTEVAPRSISFPFHYHCGAEEAIYVLRGRGVARIGDARVDVGPGDWIAFPPGPAHAHQMINDTDEPLVYLCLSAHMQHVEIVGYPDSNKVLGMAGTFDKPVHRWLTRQGESLDYWDGEPNA